MKNFDDDLDGLAILTDLLEQYKSSENDLSQQYVSRSELYVVLWSVYQCLLSIKYNKD